MIKPKLNSILLSFLPVIAIAPIIINFLQGIHGGGGVIVRSFLLGAINPSLNREVVSNSINGLIDTLGMATLSWILSFIIGSLLALLCSYKISNFYCGNDRLANVLRKILVVPRSIHELIWCLLLVQLLGLSKWTAILALLIPYTSIFARVISEQIDILDFKTVKALRNNGSYSHSAITLALIPQLLPILISYSGYRLECAIRGATILGIFGMGGIGTELELTLRSLEFREMWTSLWILGLTIFILEKLIGLIRRSSFNNKILTNSLGKYIVYFILIAFISLYYFLSDTSLPNSIGYYPIELPTFDSLNEAFDRLPLPRLIANTLFLTIFSSAISIGLPPLIRFCYPNRKAQKIQNFIWLLFRLIPPPLSALILQMVSYPGLYIGILALGIHNCGIMGRFLNENIENQGDDIQKSIQCSGVDERIGWLYGSMSQQSESYLSYGAYRADVILRDTAIVGLVGKTGLGRQIIESLSSFDWSELAILITTYYLLTLFGEIITQEIRDQFQVKDNMGCGNLKLQV